MERFSKFAGLAAPLDRRDVDTDQIIPQKFLKMLGDDGFGNVLFNHWRYQGDGSPDLGFVLNLPRYQGASILVTRSNFGCGSSREHAVWALRDFGFKVIIAESFADIFQNNAFNNGLLCIALDTEMAGEWIGRINATEGYKITVDLAGQTLTGPDGFACTFAMDPGRKADLLEGRDFIGRTLEYEDAVSAFEASHPATWQANVATDKEVA